MRIIPDKENLYSKFANAAADVWGTTNLTFDEVATLIELDEESVPNIIDISQAIGNYNRWIVFSFYRKITFPYPKEISNWEATSLNYDFLATRVNFLEYYSFDIFNRLANSPREDHRAMATKACSDEVLWNLSKDNSGGVRREAFARLGPKALDNMLVDSRSEVRELGVTMAPINYPKLNDMTNDISIKVITQLVKKIDVGGLPYILGNRNFSKNAIIRQTIEQRLSAFGECNDDE